MEVPDEFFRRVVEVAMNEGEEPEARYEDQPSLVTPPKREQPDPIHVFLDGRGALGREGFRGGRPAIMNRMHDPSRYAFSSRRAMRTRRMTAARKIGTPAYCPGVSPKYLASPMRRKSRKKRAGT